MSASRNNSLRRQILPPLTVICMLGVATVSWESARLLDDAVKSETAERASMITDSVVYGAEVVSRGSDLQRLVTALGAEPDVQLVVVASHQPARVLAATQREWVGMDVAALTDSSVVRALSTLGGSAFSRFHANVDWQWISSSPINLNWLGDSELGGLDARVVVVVSPQRTRALQRDIVNTLLVVGLLTSLGVVGGLYILLDRRLLRPLTAIDGALQRRHAGDVSAHVPVGGTGETENLGRVLNELIDGLAAKETEIRSILDTAEEPVISVDHAGIVRFWNPGAARLFEWTSAEAVGRPLTELILRPVDRHAHQRGLARFVANADSRPFSFLEVTAVCKNGCEVPVELLISARAFDGQWRFDGFVYDLSARHEIEAALRLARQEAVDAAALKGNFLATVSHELRTPLNGIIGMSELLLESGLDAEQREGMEIVNTSAMGLLAMVNDILDFSKLESGTFRVGDVPFELLAPVEETFDVVAQRAAAKGIELTLAWAPALPRLVRGDPQRVKQILVNLVGNAVKFAEGGEVRVSIRPLDSAGDRPVVRFEVADEGPGIPAAAQEKLFAPFVQLDGSTTRRHGGTGLGLAISHELIGLMHGRIGAGANDGPGSTFWFEIPFGACAPAKEGAPVDLAGRRILLLVAIATRRNALREQLVAWNARVDAVSDVTEALGRVRRSDAGLVDVVIIDRRLDAMDGVLAARALRRVLTAAPPKFVLLCGRHDLPDADDVGVDAVLAKPVRQKRLIEALERFAGSSVPGAFARPADAVTKVQENRPRLLLAEDDLTNQRVVRAMLRRLGCDTDLVADGQGALEAVKATAYDLVLMDCDMPTMDGLTATRAIRAWEGDRRHTTIIAMTANVMAGDQQRCLAAGTDDYLPKPFTGAQLAGLLRAYVGPLRALPERRPTPRTGATPA